MRTILHSDLNAFYASVECLYRPELRGLPVAVCGDPNARHGIILTKSQEAKAFGVKTGEAIWQAKKKCPGLVLVESNMDSYVRFAGAMRGIYMDYSDRVEPFGMDEAWIDVSGEDGPRIAGEIRRRAKEELGLTASIGVADNKIFAKLGSDMKKPDATTVITHANFREKVWPLPVGDLLYVGPSTLQKLNHYGIGTIGQLANFDVSVLRAALGKAGDTLHTFANGLDRTPVLRAGDEAPAKSIGNSTTTARDLVSEEDVKWVFMMLAEAIGARMRTEGLRASEVQIWVRDTEMCTMERQVRLAEPTDIDGEILGAAMAVFRDQYGWMRPIRSIGIRLNKLSFSGQNYQLSMFDDPKREKQRALEKAMDGLRERFGDRCIRRAYLYCDMEVDGKALAASPHKEYKPFECVRQG